TFINTEVGDLKIIKVDQHQQAVSGAVFEISGTSGFEDVEEIGTTDSNGFIIVTGIEAGTYYIREKSAPAGYVKSDEVEMVTISKNEVATVTFINTEIGDLKIVKVDQFENAVPGAVFEMSMTSDFAAATEIGTTDSEGLIEITGMETGTYYVREKTAPAGYTKSDEVKTVVITRAELATVTFINIEKGDLKIVKIDQFGTPVSGAVFEFSTTSNFAQTVLAGTTDASGFITVAGIDAGTYYVREKTAPAGYVKSDEVKTVTIDKDAVATVTFTNIEQGDLRIIKVNQIDERIAGAVFEISQTNDFAQSTEVGTTDADGVILVTGMDAGVYYVREKTAPAGYKLTTEVKTVTIDKDTVAEVSFLNMKDGMLRILKKDAATLGNIQGAVFGIYEDEECTILVNDTEYTTDVNGVIEVALADGVYYVRENAAPKGYKLDSTPIKITMADGATQEITIFNTSDETEEEEEPQTGTNDYLFLSLGMLLLLAGLLLFAAYRKTAKNNN
ncbi:MAG: MSCRAMM family protein, partial [Saccharofermentanales bacterium]